MIEETSLFRYDEQLRREGYLSLCGVDEAGRGPLAGPVVAAAVILPEDALQRCPKLAILNDSKKLELAVFILFLIPGVPKDALTYIAPLTRIKPSSFFLLSMLARSPAIIMSTFFGANLGEGNILEAVILFALVAVFGIIGVLYSDRILMLDKDKKEDLKEDLKKIRKK